MYQASKMYFTSTIALGLLALPSGFAGPLSRRDTQVQITQKDFNTIKLYEQFSAAAYCKENFSPQALNGKIRCSTGNCGDVEKATTKIVLPVPETGLSGSTGYVAVDSTNNLTVVAFRGSETARNFLVADALSAVLVDINTNIAPGLCQGGCSGGFGFVRSWTDVRQPIIQAVTASVKANPTFKILVTGHSLGAATASIAALELRKIFPQLNVDLGAIASPRIGNAALAKAITNQGLGNQGRNYRVSHLLDSVPNAPDRLFFPAFVHIDPVYVIDSPSRATVLINNINRDDNSSLKDNIVPLSTTFNQRRDAHTWYFNNISLCNTAATGVVAYPFADLAEVVRYAGPQDSD